MTSLVNAIPKPTELRISTITAICSINTLVNLAVVMEALPINDCVKYIEHGTHHKGARLKKISEKKKMKKKIFQNQATLILKISPTRHANVKIFRNGKVQMTGLKNIEDGHVAAHMLVDLLRPLKNDDNGAISHPDQMAVTDFKIVLINTDFHAQFQIQRVALHDIIENHYGLFCKYEPCIYPGVDTKFYWNKAYPQDGLCHCQIKCNGKGYGHGEGDCKRITIATFQSGSIIITGARSMEQVYAARTFILRILSDHYNDVRKKLPLFMATSR